MPTEPSDPTALQLISSPIPSLLQQLRQETLSAPDLRDLQQTILADHTSNPDLQFCDGLIYQRGHIRLTANSALKTTLLQQYHTSPVGGHCGYRRTLYRLKQHFIWSNLQQDVQTYVSTCPICQSIKYQPLAPAGLLQPLPIPQAAWEDLAMDFITHLPQTTNKSTILVVIGRLTKYAHFIPLPTVCIAQQVASTFIKEVCCHHGIPRTIISDRDRIFMSSFWRTIFKELGTQLSFSTAHHPQTDGQTEITNRGLEQYMRCYVLENPKAWRQFLPWAEYSYNAAFHSAIDMTPFHALCGRLPPPIEPYSGGAISNSEVHAWFLHRDTILQVNH